MKGGIKMTANFTESFDIGMAYLYKQGAFLTSRDDKRLNTMTISWGTIGFAWGKPIFMVLVRKSRYTHDIIEKSKEFTVSIPLNTSMKEGLLFCGTRCGKLLNKFEECNLLLQDGKSISTPVIRNCGLHYECKVIYQQEMNQSDISKEIMDSSYRNSDFHTLYFGEILENYKL